MRALKNINNNKKNANMYFAFVRQRSKRMQLRHCCNPGQLPCSVSYAH